MIKPIAIRSARVLSAQDSFSQNDLLQPLLPMTENRFVYKEPVYTDYFTIMQLRRMSRITRLGMVAAIECLKDAKDPQPEAIITGTGKGSLQDTEKFMHAIREFAEGTLNPSPFIQSTYNSLNGLIGLHHNVNSYNSTYVHSGFSLEHAIIDAALQLNEGSIKTALVGAFEEMTPEHYIIKNKLDFWKKDPLAEDGSSTPGAISGEGTSFFFLETAVDTAPLQILDLSLWFEPESGQDILDGTRQMLAANGISPNQVDVYLSGRNKDSRYDHYYDAMASLFSAATHELEFKQVSGEYDTASGFGLWAAVQMAARNELFPILIRQKGTTSSLKYMLLYNQYYGKQHSVYLLKQGSR